MSLPIQVSLDPKGQLNLAPVQELENCGIMHKYLCFLKVVLEPGEDSLLKGTEGLNLEILAEFEHGEV